MKVGVVHVCNTVLLGTHVLWVGELDPGDLETQLETLSYRGDHWLSFAPIGEV